MLLKLFILTNRHFEAPLKENKIKNRGFVDSGIRENMSRTSWTTPWNSCAEKGLKFYI